MDHSSIKNRDREKERGGRGKEVFKYKDFIVFDCRKYRWKAASQEYKNRSPVRCGKEYLEDIYEISTSSRAVRNAADFTRFRKCRDHREPEEIFCTQSKRPRFSPQRDRLSWTIGAHANRIVDVRLTIDSRIVILRRERERKRKRRERPRTRR